MGLSIGDCKPSSDKVTFKVRVIVTWKPFHGTLISAQVRAVTSWPVPEKPGWPQDPDCSPTKGLQCRLLSKHIPVSCGLCEENAHFKAFIQHPPPGSRFKFPKINPFLILCMAQLDYIAIFLAISMHCSM